MRRRVLAGWIFVVAMAAAVTAQAPSGPPAELRRETGYVGLHQAVLDARCDTLALIVAAHPDDQWMLPATYLRFRHGVRVAVLLFTRGKGGQNSSGPETGDALGRLRTWEAEVSASYMGAKIYYLNRPDNGFSRTAEETLDEWGEAQTVQDFARLIRKIEPDLVLTTHDPQEKHGHDQALLRVLPRAVQLAGDPEHVVVGLPQFPVSRLFRGATDDEENDICVSLEMDTPRDEVRGRTYRELAYEALEEHRSQAPLQEMDALFPPILELVSVSTNDDPENCTLFDGLPDLFDELIDVAPDAVHPDDFAALYANLRSLPDLSTKAIELQKRLRAIPASPGSALARRLARRMAAVERVIMQSARVHVFMKVPRTAEAAFGDDLPLQVWIGNEGNHRVTGLQLDARNGGALRLVGAHADRTSLAPEESLALEALYRPPALSEEDVRRIYSRDTFEQPLRVRFRFAIDGQPITIERVIDKTPQSAFQLSVTPRTLMIPATASRVPFILRVERKTRRPLDLNMRVKAPAGMRVDYGRRRERMEGNERFREFMFVLKAPHARPGVSAMHVHAGSQRIRVNVHKVDVRVAPGLRVGLIPGVDDTAYEVLQALIGDARLQKFEPNRPLPILDQDKLDTIVVDIRALRSASVRAGFARLLEFVRAGGRLVVFYHKDSEFNIDTASFIGAPYKLRIGKGRVTQQDAPVKLLLPEHPLFNYPNEIRSQDWDGWRQERGLYFPETWDESKYEALLAMNDDGFPEERGSLLYARHGDGDYVYCALALWRQLKNRHPGACRLFANLISPRPASR